MTMFWDIVGSVLYVYLLVILTRFVVEITRQFAPYFGIEQEWRLGNSADYARRAGEHASQTNVVAGLRFWF